MKLKGLNGVNLTRRKSWAISSSEQCRRLLAALHAYIAVVYDDDLENLPNLERFNDDVQALADELPSLKAAGDDAVIAERFIDMMKRQKVRSH